MGKSSFSSRHIIVLSFLPLLLLILGACAHVMIAVVYGYDFGWDMFALWLTSLVIATLFWMVVSWRSRQKFEARAKLLIFDAGGTFLWYWAFAPIYQYLIMNFSVEQSAVNAFAFFWEVPVVGGLAVLLGQWQFRPLNKYLKTGHTDNPEKLYRQAETLPYKVIIRNSIAATAGFLIGALQIQHFVGLSSVELAKDIVLGFVVSIFVSLYYFLVFYILIGPIKSRLETQYGLRKIKRTRYHIRVLTIITMITLGSLSLMLNLFVNNFQTSIRETLVSDGQRRLDSIQNEAQLSDQALVESLRFGKNGVVYTIPASAPIPLEDVSRDTRTDFWANQDGWIQDEGSKPKLVGFRTIGDQKVITVVYVNDFYGPLFKTFESLAIGAALVVLVTIGATLIFVSVLARTLQELDAGVKQARRTGDYRSTIDTGDEFEDISRGFGHFVHETKRHSKQLSEEHARLEASLNGLQIGMIITDTEGNVINSNVAAQQILLGEDPLPKTIASITTSLAYSLPIEENILLSLKTVESVHQNNVTFGTKFLNMFVAPIVTETKQAIGTITVIQDVTEAHVLQRSRDEFFSIASHELRTPLTAIRGNAQMIQQFFEQPMKDNPQLKDMIVDMHSSSVRLIDIVNDFLDVSRLEQGKVVFKMNELALDKTIETVIYDMQASMKDKNLSLTIDKKTLGKLPHIWADEGRTKQVLYNLIGNAAKFTTEGGITIDAFVTGKMVKVTISDTGPGIAEKMQKLLFHKFQQAGESLLTRDTTRGTGLGLYISKSIVESMGGHIALESSVEGKGSTFSFSLPIMTKKHNVHTAASQQIDATTGITK